MIQNGMICVREHRRFDICWFVDRPWQTDSTTQQSDLRSFSSRRRYWRTARKPWLPGKTGRLCMVFFFGESKFLFHLFPSSLSQVSDALQQRSGSLVITPNWEAGTLLSGNQSLQRKNNDMNECSSSFRMRSKKGGQFKCLFKGFFHSHLTNRPAK